jgi:hypothetical protein
MRSIFNAPSEEDIARSNEAYGRVIVPIDLMETDDSGHTSKAIEEMLATINYLHPDFGKKVDALGHVIHGVLEFGKYKKNGEEHRWTTSYVVRQNPDQEDSPNVTLKRSAMFLPSGDILSKISTSKDGSKRFGSIARAMNRVLVAKHTHQEALKAGTKFNYQRRLDQTFANLIRVLQSSMLGTNGYLNKVIALKPIGIPGHAFGLLDCFPGSTGLEVRLAAKVAKKCGLPDGCVVFVIRYPIDRLAVARLRVVSDDYLRTSGEVIGCSSPVQAIINGDTDGDLVGINMVADQEIGERLLKKCEFVYAEYIIKGNQHANLKTQHIPMPSMDAFPDTYEEIREIHKRAYRDSAMSFAINIAKSAQGFMEMRAIDLKVDITVVTKTFTPWTNFLIDLKKSKAPKEIIEITKAWQYLIGNPADEEMRSDIPVAKLKAYLKSVEKKVGKENFNAKDIYMMMDKVCGKNDAGDIHRMYHVRNEVDLLRVIKTRCDDRHDNFQATKRLLMFWKNGRKKNQYLTNLFNGKEVR